MTRKGNLKAVKNSKSNTLKLEKWYCEIETYFKSGSQRMLIGIVSSFLNK